jgi:A/G-specific adenine glycosylase
MRRFPTVEALAQAPLDEVLKLWEGLGYYARARNLSKAARMVVEKHGGRVPDTLEAISALPGIGTYTAAAVLSIAWNQDHAVVDGNVIRVVSRLFRIPDPPIRTAVRREISRRAHLLLLPGRAADFNQAMMELGATVCAPRRPRCVVCPVRTLCRAYLETPDPSTLPTRTERKPKPHRDVVAIILQRHNRVLIRQRPDHGLLGGLWEFPGDTRREQETIEECLQRNLSGLTDAPARVERAFDAVPHVFSHFTMTLRGYLCRCEDEKHTLPVTSENRWVAREELSGYAFPKAFQRLIEQMKTRFPEAERSGEKS